MSVDSSIRRHVIGGLAAGVGSMSTMGALYHRQFACLDLDWPLWFLAMAAYGLVGGFLIGQVAGRAERRGAGWFRTILWGASMGVVPGYLGVFGFGSQHAPYPGTPAIVASVLAGAAAYAVALAPRRDLRRFGIAVATAVVSVGSVGVLVWLFSQTLRLVPDFDVFRSLAGGMGAPFGFALGVGLGIAAGLFIAMARWLDLAMARAVGYES